MSGCERCEAGTGRHNGTGPGFGCRIKHVQFDPSAMPSRFNHVETQAFNNNSWERGVATHDSGLPFLGPDLEPIPLHQWQTVGSGYEHQFAAERAAGAAPSPSTTVAPDPAAVG